MDAVCAYGGNITLSEVAARYILVYQALVDMGMDNCMGALDITYEFVGLQRDVLDACERGLRYMNEDERQIIVCGKQTDAQNVMVEHGLDAYVLQSFLYLAFDGPYSGMYRGVV